MFCIIFIINTYMVTVMFYWLFTTWLCVRATLEQFISERFLKLLSIFIFYNKSLLFGQTLHSHDPQTHTVFMCESRNKCFDHLTRTA